MNDVKKMLQAPLASLFHVKNFMITHLRISFWALLEILIKDTDCLNEILNIW